jgi:pimeloyl-ACP methyl ester carboxylesterase
MPKATTRDIVTYYEEAGRGEPLLMIMGISGDLQGWALQVPELSKHFRVITYDNRGAGRSSAPDRPYSIKQMAGDACALLDHLGIAKTHVLGFSMGGYVAQEFAIAHPERVNKLILLATAPSIDGFGRVLVRSLMDMRRSSMSREQFVRAMAPFLYSPELLDDEDRYERAILNSVSNPYSQSDVGFLRQAEAILDFDASDRIANVKSPALVVVGKDDILVPPRNSEKLAKLLPSATLKELSGGHIGCIEYPAEYNGAFLEFLSAAG